MAAMGGAISLAAGYAAASAFEAGSLAGAWREIDAELRCAVERLEACSGAHSNHVSESIAAACSALRRATGALTLAGLEAAARIAHATAELLQDGASSGMPRTLPIAIDALAALRAHVADIEQGIAHQPLHLLGLFTVLCEARGEPAPEPLALYFPDISARPLARRDAPLVLPPNARAQYVRDQRTRYERGLLLFLKRDPSGARAMRAALEAVERLPEGLEQHAFWAVMLAFLDALAANLLRSEDRGSRAVIRLCQRLDGRLRAMAAGGQAMCEIALHEALYFIARATPAIETLREVREKYNLEESFPPADLRWSAAGNRQLADLWIDAVSAWDRFTIGHAGALGAFCAAAEQLCLAVKGLESGLDPELASLLARMVDIGAALQREPACMSEALALEQNVALLLVGRALTGAAAADLGPQAALAATRMEEAFQGSLLRTAPQDPVLQLLFHRAQDALVARQAAAESRGVLEDIERSFAEYVREPGRAGELSRLAEPLERLDHSLELLGEASARASLAECRAQIARFSASDFVPEQPQFEQLCDAVAERLCALGARLEQLLQHHATLGARPAVAIDVELFPHPPAASQGEPVPDTTLQIGPVRIAAGTFALWSGEARMQITTLATERDTLKTHGVISDDMLGAARALAEAAASISLDTIGALARALDQALTALAIGPLSSDEEALIDQAVEVLERMVMEALELREPVPLQGLVQSLRQLASPGAASSDDPDFAGMASEEVAAAFDASGRAPGS